MEECSRASWFQATTAAEAGAADGDHAVTQDDIDLVRERFGARAGDEHYLVAADVNRDG